MIETQPGASDSGTAVATEPRDLRSWLREGAFGPTELSHRGVLLVLLSVVVVIVPVVGLTLLSVEVHLALKVSVLAVTVVALVGAALRVIADARPTPRSDLDRAGKVIGAVAALFTALAVILDWGGLDLL
ncbi:MULTISPECIES: hypothetical protein [unclassified Rathayibacter]|uniref:hypothetical protein n=1 Tax=unclassified Rathayibacter TaxID=2609250 RepID=UPI0006F59B8C|nr:MULTISPECIES: hypothetical protein [unclassified Rathayibacter]KQQ05597.1 hypothetical protein ASF42_03255 [Rathayibacter sp. Leaf294]KQS13458.1 hypothetical protein ASG06_03265 [Rathayibacter sp. Leaf185]